MKKGFKAKAMPKSIFERDFEVKGKTAVYRGKSNEIDLEKIADEMDKRGIKKVVIK